MMSEYGNLYEKSGRYVLAFERNFPFNPEEVFRVISDPDYFSQWYPFATGEMDLKVGGEIKFDDGEGSTYVGKISHLDAPHSFCFQEVDDLLEMKIQGLDSGCVLTFIHTFDDPTMAMYIATGWHRCLDVLSKLIYGQPIEWENNVAELRDYYRDSFHVE